MLLSSSRLCGLLLAVSRVSAIYEPAIVSFDASDGAALDISNPDIIIDSADFLGVHIAATNLAADFGNVTGAVAQVQSVDGVDGIESQAAIIVGTLNNSRAIQELVASGKLDVAQIEGKWESFVASLVEQPFEGVDAALVIAGSDKRGAIYGLYTISEQIGVSPWYWWADVPILRRDSIFALPTTTVFGEPSVKHRGLFINDEAPALSSWVFEKFGKYNTEFYKHVFELLLRLKANYLWPAMWPGYPYPGNSFFVDDPLNQQTADDYGIVVSTSHHEPMQRATNEWLQSGNGTWDWASNKENITTFFQDGARRAKGYESYFTMGMRGSSDGPISGDDPIKLMEDIVSTQRAIIKDVYGNETGVNQVWALYKEVQLIYDQGFQVPEDITLLFADDNHGNIRRLPNETERQRAGGAGIYYHMEYVGTPISYKWMNTNSLGKILHQLSLAKTAGADRIWVFNVADIRPMEIPLTMSLTFAYNSSSITKDSIPDYLFRYAQREIPDAQEDEAKEIASLIYGHSRLVGIRKHEHAEATNFVSLVMYNEGARWYEAWQTLSDRVETLSKKISQASWAAFFQIVYQPIKASQVYYHLRLAQARNSLFGLERANSANDWAAKTLDLFDEDYDIQEEWNGLLNGKWNQIMSQPHYGYQNTWPSPIRDMITGVSYVQKRQKSVPAVGNIGVRVDGSLPATSDSADHVGLFNEGHHLSKPSRNHVTKLDLYKLPQFSPYNPVQWTWILLYARGPGSLKWFITSPEDWIHLSPTEGTFEDSKSDQLVNITVDWDQVPEGFNGNVTFQINSTDADAYEHVVLPISNIHPDESFIGYVESSGVVSILGPHYSTASDTSGSEVSYDTFHHLGRSIEEEGVIGLFPYNASVPSIPSGPYLDYTFYLFHSVQNLTVYLYFTMALDTFPASPLTYALSLDGSTPNTTRLTQDPATAGDLPKDWSDSIMNLAWQRTQTFAGNVTEGAHTIRYWAGNVGILLEKIVVDAGGLKKSYLGPPESVQVGN